MTYNFEEMAEKALNIEEDNNEVLIYELDDELLKKGYDYDESGVYIPYTPEYQSIGVDYLDKDRFKTEDNIFLKIHRVEDTRASILIKCTWTRKKEDNTYQPYNHFNIECEWGEILDEYAKFNADGSVKSNRLNMKASATGLDSNLPASEGSYETFMDDVRKTILLSSGLEVLKNKNYEWPTISDDEEDEVSTVPQCFADYPEDVQEGALYLIENNLLKENIIDTVSTSQYGNAEVKRSLILTTTTPYVAEPQDTLIDGKRGGGKTALILEILKNYPDTHVFHYQSFSAKNMFYDKDKFNPDGVNILILDDPNLNNEERVDTIKTLADNEKPIKTLHTVMKQKAVEFQLTGKFLIIITYAKEIDDDELANRLHNISIIIDDQEKIPIKNKIKFNAISNIKNNVGVKKLQEYNKAAIHYLSEKNMKVFNPCGVFVNVNESNNRDVTDLMSLILADGFLNYSKLKSIQVNGVELVIGSFEEVADNVILWNKDAYQSDKLSSKQKEIMDLLPTYTDEEIEEGLSKVLNKVVSYDSLNAKTRELESKFYTLNRITKEMELSKGTVNHALNRNNDKDSNTRSLVEMDLVRRVPIDSKYIQTHPNIFYKPKKETDGEASDCNENNLEAMQDQFARLINTLEGKQSILINLLIYINIIINKKGHIYLKNYCTNYDKALDVKNYDSYYNFINDFMTGLNDQHCIDVNNASVHDLMVSVDKMKKMSNIYYSQSEGQNSKMSNIPENALNENQSKNQHSETELYSFKDIQSEIEGLLDEKGIDVEIGYKIINTLLEKDMTKYNIQQKLDPFPDPENPNDKIRLAIEMNLKRLVDNNFVTTYFSTGEMYTLNDEIREMM